MNTTWSLKAEMEQQVFNDRYQVIAKIGAGGMADVYKAMDTVLDRPVAVKVLHRHFAEDEDFVTRFRREAQAAAGLNHPNVVNIYDWGSQNGTYYIVMELLEGQSLKKYISTKRVLAPAEAMEIAKKMLSALGYAHKHDIVHRDVKPHNIILTAEGEVKVTDFGIARAGASTMTQTGTILGTAHYLSPEQARGQDVGVTSDIYSSGVVLYEMLTGKVPFDGENPVAIALKHVHEMPPRAKELNPEVPDALQTIIAKAMAKNPENRYQSAAEMRNDIMRLMEGMPIVAIAPDEQATLVMAPPAGSTQRSERTARTAEREPEFHMSKSRNKSKTPMVLLSIILLLVLGGGAWLATQSGLLAGATMVAVPNIQNKSFPEAKQLVEEKKLKIKKVGERFSNTLGPNIVISQTPNPGDKLAEGSVVEVTVSKGPETKSVPDVIGDSSISATTTLIKTGLDVGDHDYEYSDDVEQGSVIRTDPEAGAVVEAGTPVNLIISRGQEALQVPDTQGEAQSEADAILKEAGFITSVSEEFSDSVDKGNVIRTTPAGGNEAKKGSTVTLYVSKGPQMVTVPDVRGKLEDQAKDILANAGFSVEVEEIQNVSPDNDSRVISQDPSSGEQLKKSEAKITIFVGTSD